MLGEKQINESKNRIINFIKEGIVQKGKETRFVHFFLKNAKNSLETAKLLFEVSTKDNLKEELGLPNFNGFLWTINSSYYSIFYLARALLESQRIKIKTDHSIHMVTFDALIYYFYSTGKLEKRFIEDLIDAKEETALIQGKEKSNKLVQDYYNERVKRATFTYETGEIAMQNKAKTSLERAKRFNEETRKIIEL